MRNLEVLFNLCDKMVLECSLDGLVEEVRGEEFVNIRSWEVGCVRLVSTVSTHAGVVAVCNPPESQGQFHERTIVHHRPLFRGVSIVAPVCEARLPSCRGPWGQRRSWGVSQYVGIANVLEHTYVTHHPYTIPAATDCSG